MQKVNKRVLSLSDLNFTFVKRNKKNLKYVCVCKLTQQFPNNIYNRNIIVRIYYINHYGNNSKFSKNKQ